MGSEAVQSLDFEHDLQAPVAIEAEQSLLGCLLYAPKTFWTISDDVSSDDFYDGLHQKIFALISDRLSRGENTSLPSLAPLIDANQAFDPLGGSEYLAKLVAAVPTLQIENYSQTVVDTALKRQLFYYADELKGRASRYTETGGLDVFDEAESRLSSLKVDAGRDDTETSSQAADSALEDFTRAQETYRSGGITGITTGIPGLDRKTGGLIKKTQCILGARTSVGKTSLAVSMSNAAAKAGHGVVWFSMEMTKSQLVARHLSDLGLGRSIIPYDDILRGKLRDDQWPDVQLFQDEFSKLPIWIDDRSKLTVAQMRRSLRRLKRLAQKKGQSIDLVIIDHVMKVRGEGEFRGNKTAEIINVSGDLFAMAKDLDVACLTLSQVVRGDPAERPHTYHLKYAGELENDADRVIMLHRKAQYLLQNPAPHGDLDAAASWELEFEKEKHRAELYLDKNRNGSTGLVEAFCQIKTSSFRDQNWRRGEDEQEALV